LLKTIAGTFWEPQVNIRIISIQWNNIIYTANLSKLFDYQKLEVNLT
jgi:hypothetical protein